MPTGCLPCRLARAAFYREPLPPSTGAVATIFKIEIDATGGTAYTLMGINQFVAVPYALHAKTAENGFSGSYNDLTNVPAFRPRSHQRQLQRPAEPFQRCSMAPS